MHAGVFLERDGILNLVRVVHQHPLVPLRLDEFRLNSEALEPLCRLKRAGFLLLVTRCENRAAVGRDLRRSDRAHAHDVVERERLADVTFGRVQPREENQARQTGHRAAHSVYERQPPVHRNPR